MFSIHLKFPNKFSILYLLSVNFNLMQQPEYKIDVFGGIFSI